MSRILVDPDQLQSVASQFADVTGRVQQLGRRAAGGLDHLDWASASLNRVFARMLEAGRMADVLAVGSAEREQELRQTAARFLEANAWRPVRAGTAKTGTSGEAVVDRPVGGGPVSGPTEAPPASDPSVAAVYAHFANPQMQSIMAHVIAKEGMGAANVAHGAVVYQSENGWRCDEQWLNFGYISFAMPAGSGQSVLRKILSTPGEAEAFRAIAARHLTEFPGGTVPASHQHFVQGSDIPALTAGEQADQFIALLQGGDKKRLAEWFFKYANEPATHHDVPTGKLRANWDAILGEFLARPASVEAQLDAIQRNYVDPATDSAERFGLHSVKGVAWFVDQHVQSGGPSKVMLRMLEGTPPPASDPLFDEWQRFQGGGEQERLQVLTELAGSPDTTVRKRREAVLANPALTWASFTGAN